MIQHVSSALADGQLRSEAASRRVTALNNAVGTVAVAPGTDI